MSNSISFIGRIGQDPELKTVGETAVLEFSIANETGFGEKKNTNWFRAKIWGKKAMSLDPHLAKGKQIFITGELTLRKYTNKEGHDGWSHDINVASLDFCNSPKSDEKEDAPF